MTLPGSFEVWRKLISSMYLPPLQPSSPFGPWQSIDFQSKVSSV
jgi:hypothetical protein